MTKWSSFARGAGSLLVAGLTELLLFLPVVLAVYLWRPQFEVPFIVLLALLLAAYAAGCVCNALTKFTHPFPRVMIGVILAGACGYLLYGLTVEGAVTLVYLAAAIFRGSGYAVTPAVLRMLPRTYVLGTAFYFAGSVVYQFNETFRDYRSLYLACGLLTLGLTLYQANRGTVGRETLSGDAKPAVDRTVRRHNRLFVGIAAVISVLIVLTYQLQEVFGALGRGIKSLLGGLLSGGGEEPPVQTGQEALPPPEMPGLAEGSKGLPFWVELIFYSIAGALVLFVLWLLLRKLKELPEWLKRLQSKLAEFFRRDRSVMASGYVDEVERIRNTGSRLSFWKNRSKEHKLKWKDLADNEARVRYLYRRWIGAYVKKGYTFKPHSTPLEIGSDVQTLGGSSAGETALLEAYQRVRYGKENVANELLEQLIDRDGGVKR
ncbi:DUF4129 domain-containing protein [Paenibacillus montanisoli]|uniref:Uncharacterized protein n=1 Tax=Paenibacillus montanisoli TaxID=2081970 RepID=A0A328U6R9_9BACL|nr:DUF4129 domain-containing protein [Paenibacillus montanisoli]RAP78269.1 hypothetical protein DL346_07525 [Paenibacillus montanisoli]